MTTLNELPHTFIETFLRHVTMIKFIGIDIFDQTENSFMKKYAKSVIILLCTVFMLLGQILYVVKKDEIGAQFLEVVSSIPIILSFGQALVKMLVLMVKRNEIREVIMKIGHIWPTEIVNDEKMKTMRFFKQRLNLFGNVLLKAAVVTLILFELLPLATTIYDMNTKTNAQYQFTTKMYFFHYLDSHYLYAIAYIFEAITCIMVYLCVYIACELLLVALILDISALLIFLKIDLENIINSSELQTIDEEDNCDSIKDIIILHQELLSIADDVNKIFGMIIFTQISFTSVVICCYGFMALMANGLFLNYITASLGVMFEIFILSYPGQMLADTSSDIGNAAYHCHWYERGIKFRKYILVIITRSQKPCLMSALGFSDLTQKMFSKVMSSSWSYLSLLNQMYSDL